jgi:hypothetical protein
MKNATFFQQEENKMRVTRNEELDPTEHGQMQFSPGPRAELARSLQDAWRPDHRPPTLREEVDARERGPRQNLLHQLRNAHLPDATQYNARVDALADLSPREALAKEIAGMWKGPK